MNYRTRHNDWFSAWLILAQRDAFRRFMQRVLAPVPLDPDE